MNSRHSGSDAGKSLISKPMIITVAAMLVSVISLISLSQAGLIAGVENTATTEQPAAATRMLSFIDHSDGSVEVLDQSHNATVHIFKSGEGSFVRGTVRTLTRERRSKGFDKSLPFELRAEASTKLFLIDHATGRTLLLNAFGKDNTATFEKLLTAKIKLPPIALHEAIGGASFTGTW